MEGHEATFRSSSDFDDSNELNSSESENFDIDSSNESISDESDDSNIDQIHIVSQSFGTLLIYK